MVNLVAQVPAPPNPNPNPNSDPGQAAGPPPVQPLPGMWDGYDGAIPQPLRDIISRMVPGQRTALALSCPGLSDGEARVLGIIAGHNWEGCTAQYPTLALLAEKSEKQISRIINRLAAKGALRFVRTYGAGGYRTPFTRITIMARGLFAEAPERLAARLRKILKKTDRHLVNAFCPLQPRTAAAADRGDGVLPGMDAPGADQATGQVTGKAPADANRTPRTSAPAAADAKTPFPTRGETVNNRNLEREKGFDPNDSVRALKPIFDQKSLSHPASPFPTGGETGNGAKSAESSPEKPGGMGRCVACRQEIMDGKCGCRTEKGGYLMPVCPKCLHLIMDGKCLGPCGRPPPAAARYPVRHRMTYDDVRRYGR